MIQNLADRLKESRLKLSMSQKSVANMLNVSPSLISAYESGERTPSVEMLLSLSYLYRCTTDYLLGKDEKNAPIAELDAEGLSREEICVLKELIRIIKR